MSFPWLEFITLMATFAVAAISPGPDFAMVVRQSIVHGRKTAILTSAGIASAILVHGTYTILGIGLVVTQSLLLFNLLKLAGAAYLLWLGISSIRAPAPKPPAAPGGAEIAAQPELGGGQAYVIGLLTNLLNPKAMLFFLSLFTTLVGAHTAVSVKSVYVGSMSVMLFVWFTLVSLFFTTPSVRAGFYRLGQWFNRITGAALIFLAIRVAVTQRN